MNKGSGRGNLVSVMYLGRVNDFPFFDCSSSFYYLLFEFRERVDDFSFFDCSKFILFFVN